MPEDFQFDVFVSHSAKDKPAVRELAARLQRDGVRVRLDEEQIKSSDNIPAKIEEGWSTRACWGSACRSATKAHCVKRSVGGKPTRRNRESRMAAIQQFQTIAEDWKWKSGTWSSELLWSLDALVAP